jgi:hypothetical protein
VKSIDIVQDIEDGRRRRVAAEIASSRCPLLGMTLERISTDWNHL